MNDFSVTHLQSKTAAQLELSDDERIQIIRSGMFIDMPRFKPIFKRLQEMIEAPRVVRPQSLLLVAPSNNGKSSIFEHFLHETNGAEDPGEEVAEMRVLMINTPPSGDRTAFYQRILGSMFGEFNERSKLAALRSQAIRQLRTHSVKLLLLDELHDALSGTIKQQDLFNAEIKQFSNETKIPIAAAGLDKAPALFFRDSQMTSRFDVVDLPPFQPDKELASLLVTLGRRLPLRHPSGLSDSQLVAEVSRRAEGAIGDIYSLMAYCAIEAIKDGTEAITLKALRKAEWQRPTQRAAFTRSGRRKLLAEIKRNDEAFALELAGAVDDEENENEQAPDGVGDESNGLRSTEDQQKADQAAAPTRGKAGNAAPGGSRPPSETAGTGKKAAPAKGAASGRSAPTAKKPTSRQTS